MVVINCALALWLGEAASGPMARVVMTFFGPAFDRLLSLKRPYVGLEPLGTKMG